MDDEELENNQEQEQGSSLAEQVKDNAQSELSKKATKEATKKAATKAGAQTAAKTAASSSLAGALAYVLAIVLLVILIIIVAVGIIMFFITMPGMVMQQLEALMKDIGNGWNSFFGEDETEQVDDEEIYGVLGYLEKMGYDLLSYGFLTGYAAGDGYDNGVRRDDNGNIKGAFSTYVKTYLVSDNYAYTLKADNYVTSWWGEGFILGIKRFFGGSTQGFGRGLISIYYEKDGQIGIKGDEFTGGTLSQDKAWIDQDKKTLSIQRGWFKDYYAYDLDGWTGRYSMPLEFLLSVHVATMMPDLAYDLATSFDTDVEILLHASEDETIAGYKQEWVPNGDTDINGTKYSDIEGNENLIKPDGGTKYITLAAFEKILSQVDNLWSWLNFDGLTLDKKEALAILRLGIRSPDNCLNIKNQYYVEATTQALSDPSRQMLNLKKCSYMQEEAAIDLDSHTKTLRRILNYNQWDDDNRYSDATSWRNAFGNYQKNTGGSIWEKINDDFNSYWNSKVDRVLRIDPENTYSFTGMDEYLVPSDKYGIPLYDTYTIDVNEENEPVFNPLYLNTSLKSYINEQDNRYEGDYRTNFYWNAEKDIFSGIKYSDLTDVELKDVRLLQRYNNIEIDPNYNGTMYVIPQILCYETEFTCKYNNQNMLISSFVISLGKLKIEEDFNLEIFNSTRITGGIEKKYSNTLWPGQFLSVSILFREMTDQEKIDCGYYVEDSNGDIEITTYDYRGIPEKTRYSRSEDTKCSGDLEIEEACPVCYDHVMGIMKVLKYISGHLDTYIPYITKVTNHWYRDVYFVTSNPVTTMINDSEYEEQTGERWTDYYSYREYAKTDPSVILERLGDEERYDEDALFRYDSSASALYNCGEIYYGTIEDAKNENISLVKMPKTEIVNDWMAYDPDTEIDTSIEEWKQAYEIEDTEDETQKVKLSDDDNGDSVDLPKKSLERIYIMSQKKSDIVQIEDGKRGETNDEIKKIFLNNYYLKYDGTAETADKIYAIKSYLSGTTQEHGYTLGIPTEFKGTRLIESKEAFGAIAKSDDDEILDTNVFLNQWGSDPTQAGSWTAVVDKAANSDETVRDYAGKVSLTIDSLGAFSMLENTHTLDADFIYKDFKELIVELGYFTKEELTDSKEVFEWAIPEVSTDGWPARYADKKESEYGTFIHSKEAYEELEKEKLSETMKNETKDPAEPPVTTGAGSLGSPTEEVINPNGEALFGGDNFEGFKGGESVVSPTTGELLKYGTHKRKNVDTGEEEDVGYAVIKVLDKESYEILSKGKGIPEGKPDVKEISNNKYAFKLDDDKKSIYAYKLFYESYTLAHVAGDVMLVDGFEASGEDISSFGSGNEEHIYKADKSFEASDKASTKRVKAMIEAKKSAKTSCTAGEKVFIKEGTVLGKTTEDGKYIRIIMRTIDDEIIEDVEDYMKLDDFSGIDKNIEHFMYWQAHEPEGFYQLNDEDQRTNSSDKYGHDYRVTDSTFNGNPDPTLHPGMSMLPGNNAPIFKEVTGENPVGGKSWCTGEQLLEIYHKVLMGEINIVAGYTNYKLEGSQLYAMVDVLYAGAGFYEGTDLEKNIKEGIMPTQEDFLGTISGELNDLNYINRRRLFDYYIFTKGIYPAGMRVGDDPGTVTQYYEFNTKTPFQDFMKATTDDERNSIAEIADY